MPPLFPRIPLPTCSDGDPGITYVALVGGQTMPVLFGIMDCAARGQRVARVLLICSRDSEPESEWIRQALAELPECEVSAIDTRVIAPFDHQGIAGLISHEVSKPARVDLTGGTKLMAFGAFETATEYGFEWAYLAMECKEFIESPSGPRPMAPELFDALPIQSAFKANGQFAITRTPDLSWADRARKILEITLQEHPNQRRIFNLVLNAGFAGKDVNFVPPTLREMRNWGWATIERQERRHHVAKTLACPLTKAGDWLELYVASAVSLIPRIHELCISTEGGLGTGRADAVAVNEHDVMFLHEGRLVMLECKGGEFPVQTFEERNALRPIWGGRYAISGIVTTELESSERGKPGSLLSRATARGQFTAARDGLPDLRTRLEEFLRVSSARL